MGSPSKNEEEKQNKYIYKGSYSTDVVIKHKTLI